MFARTITMDQWAEVYEELEGPRFSEIDDVLLVKGEHPRLGAVVAVQLMEDGMSLTSELEFSDPIDQRLAAECDAVARAVVARALAGRPGFRAQKASA